MIAYLKSRIQGKNRMVMYHSEDVFTIGSTSIRTGPMTQLSVDDAVR